jgi:hypothetical protein
MKRVILIMVSASGWLLAIACVLYFVVWPSVFLKYFSGRTDVHLQYVGNEPISDVTVIVRGHHYPLGLINANSTANIDVWPASDSHLELSFSDLRGEKRILNAGGYIGPGISAKYRITFDSTRIISSDFSYNK